MQDTELSPGTILASRYRLEQLLGEGGMGLVYAAVDQQLGRRVALKLIRDDLNDAPARDRFLREAQSAAVLSHRNACQLFEVAEHEGRPFLVLEFLDGEALSARLKRGRMDREEAAWRLLPGDGCADRVSCCGSHPSRHQALERLSDAARREAARLWPGAANRARRCDDGAGIDRTGRNRGNPALHGAGAAHRRSD